MKGIATAIALTALLVAAAPASAKEKTGYYDGETVSGEPLSFAIKGKRIFDIEGYITGTCVPTSGTPIARAHEFNPPGSFRLGRTKKVSRTQYVSWWGDTTFNYKVSIKKLKGRIWAAKLHVNYSYVQSLLLGGGDVDQTVFVCQGDDTFKFIV